VRFVYGAKAADGRGNRRRELRSGEGGVDMAGSLSARAGGNKPFPRLGEKLTRGGGYGRAYSRGGGVDHASMAISKSGHQGETELRGTVVIRESNGSLEERGGKALWGTATRGRVWGGEETSSQDVIRL